jgi:IclR family pca regulon transcriptional regulator
LGDEEPNPEGDNNFMLSLARGLSVFRVFDQEHRKLTVADAARMTGLPKASARRCLYTLQCLGYVREDMGSYSLTPKVLSLGYAYLSSSTLVEQLSYVAARVTEKIQETCSAVVLEGLDSVFIVRSRANRAVNVDRAVGSRLPAYYASHGRVLLANLPDDELRRRLKKVKLESLTPKSIKSMPLLLAELALVRKQGFAINDEEVEAGARGLSVPLRGRAGDVIAALSIGVPAARVSVRDLKQKFLPVLLSTAQDFAKSLGE